MKKSFADSVLKKIHAKKITPREKSYFIAKTVLHVIAGVAFLVFGMFSVALLWHLIHNFEFVEFMWEKPHIFGKLFWFGVPLFWIILSIASWIVTEQIVQRTDRAYRIPFWMIAAAVLLIQILGGFALEQSKVGERADAMFEERMEWYQGSERMNKRMERVPEEGFLMGTVLEIKSNTMILLSDLTNKKWKVQLEENANPRRKIEEKMNVRMIGEMIGETEFIAISWRPARKRPLEGRRNKKGGNNMRPPLFNRLRESRDF